MNQGERKKNQNKELKPKRNIEKTATFFLYFCISSSKNNAQLVPQYLKKLKTLQNISFVYIYIYIYVICFRLASKCCRECESDWATVIASDTPCIWPFSHTTSPTETHRKRLWNVLTPGLDFFLSSTLFQNVPLLHGAERVCVCASSPSRETLSAVKAHFNSIKCISPYFYTHAILSEQFSKILEQVQVWLTQSVVSAQQLFHLK